MAELATLRRRVAELEAAGARQRSVEALQESEAKIRSIFRAAPVGIGLVSDRVLLDVNDRLCEITGYSRDELIGKSARILYPTDKAYETVGREKYRQIEEQGTGTVETRFQRKDGQIIDVLLSSTPLDPTDLSTGVTFTVLDVTERKQMEEALRDSEATLRQVIDLVPYPIFAKDLEGRFLLVNHAGAKFGGLTVGQMEGRLESEWVTDRELLQSIQAEDRAVIESGEPKTNPEDRFLDAQGHERVMRTTKIPLWEEGGNPTGLLGISIDITELKRAEEALRKSEERFRMTIQHSPIGLGLVDSAGDLTDCNPALAEMVGYSREELSRLSFEDFTHPDDLEREWRLINQLWDDETTQYRMEKRYIHKDGHTIWVDVAASLFKSETVGQTFGFAFVQDITERKQAEDALRQTTERIQIQREIDAAILAAQSAEEIAHATLDKLQNLIPSRRASIAEIDLARQRGRDLIFLVDGERMGGEQVWHPLSGAGQEAIEAIQQGRSHIVQDIATLEAPSYMEQLMTDRGVRAYVSVPLMVQHTLVGTLNISSETPGFFQPDHVEILEEVAASLAIALQQARLLEQTQRDAETRSLLLREVNHRVLNNLTMILSILNLEQRRSLESESDFQAALSDVASRIDGITVVHRMLSSAQWAPLDLAEVVTKVIHAGLSGSPIQHAVEVVVDAPDHPLCVSSRQAIAIALIFNELTTNSIKYAFADRSRGRIDVRIADLGDGSVRLIFRDDGPGMPGEVLAGSQKNVGLWLVEENATRALGGEIALHNDGGAVTSITFEQVSPD